MSLKYISPTKVSSCYGLDKWRTVTKATSKALYLGQSKIVLPETDLLEYDGNHLWIYEPDESKPSGRAIKVRYRVFIRP
jgi:hypothetical protein